MKKITFLIVGILSIVYSLQGNAQAVCVQEDFTATGPASTTVVTILPGDITCNGPQTLQGIKLIGATDSLDDGGCGTIFKFELVIDGTVEAEGCADQLNGFEIDPAFATIEVRSVDLMPLFNPTVTITFDLEITYEAIDHDVCSNPRIINTGHSFEESDVEYTNEWASDSGALPIPDCANYVGGDVWFAVLVPSSGSITIETRGNGGITDTGLAVYSGSCNNLVELGCDDNGGENQWSKLDFTGLAPYSVLRIRVWEYGDNNFGSFLISAYTQCHGNTVTWDGATWSPNTPSGIKSVIIDGDYDTATFGSFEACSCTVNTDKVLTINTDDNIKLLYNLENSGSVYIENKGSLIQQKDEALVLGDGTFTTQVITKPYAEYDYTYYSSPSSTATIEQALIGSGGSPSGYIYALESSNFNDQFDGDMPQTSGSPDSYDDEGDDWVAASGAMQPAKGYIAMGAGADFPVDMADLDAPATETIEFDGPFNTGDIGIEVFYDADINDAFDSQNLVGNPYPSAIDIKKIYNNNNSLLAGIFYFWTHDSPISDTNQGPWVYNYDNADYSIVATNGATFNATSGTAGSTATQFIAAGQGFLVDLDNLDDLESVSAGELVFKNSMRNENNDNFLTPTNQEVNNLDRVWLNMSSQNGKFHQVLINFMDHATEAVDKGLDAKRLEFGTDFDFYSLMSVNDKHYAIQSLPVFDIDRTVQLGMEIVEEDIYYLAIDHVEGIFEGNQDIFLVDHYTETIHNLSANGTYTFSSTIDQAIDDRFEIVFKSTTLGLNGFNYNNITIYPNPSNAIFNISWQGESNAIIQVTDISGKVILTTPAITSQERVYPIDMTHFDRGIYFVKLTTGDKQLVKKIVLR